MGKRINYFLLILVSLFSVSCNSSDVQKENVDDKHWKERWIVASRCAQVPDHPEVWWIQRNGSSDWELLYPPFVGGLERMEGYEYDIIVIATALDINDVPADGPSIIYDLYEVLSITEKESAGIPFYKLQE